MADTTQQIVWDVLSPDGFSIDPSQYYDTPEAARAAFDEWKKRYEHQGYYSSVDFGRIPLSHLWDFCKLKPLKEDGSELFDESSFDEDEDDEEENEEDEWLNGFYTNTNRKGYEPTDDDIEEDFFNREAGYES